MIKRLFKKYRLEEFYSFIVFYTLFSMGSVWGSSFNLSAIFTDALSESFPTAFAPNNLDENDFELKWVGKNSNEMRFKIIPNSIQWVRVADTLVIPRARIKIESDSIESGQVFYQGFSHSFEINHSRGSVELSVVLISDPKNTMLLKMVKNGQFIQGSLHIDFKLKKNKKECPPSGTDCNHSLLQPENGISIDSSCSPYQVWVEAKPHFSDVDWGYIGCRLVRVRGEGEKFPSLEMYLLWDHLQDVVEIGGVKTVSEVPSIWPLALNSGTTQVTIESDHRELVIHYQIPQKLYGNSLSLGLGPYQFQFQGNQENSNSLVMMPTLYGSHFLTESMRVVEFGAVTADSHLFTDLGLYLHFEQFRFLDRRLSLNLLIGVHTLGFKSGGDFHWVGSLPQGLELVLVDAFARGRNLTLGAFIYPVISGNSYYNGWIRWGSAWFFELNYIAWKAYVEPLAFQSTSIGFTLGFPLIRFW